MKCKDPDCLSLGECMHMPGLQMNCALNIDKCCPDDETCCLSGLSKSVINIAIYTYKRSPEYEAAVNRPCQCGCNDKTKTS